MIVIGAGSDISKAFVEKALSKENINNIYLLSSGIDESLVNFSAHLKVKYDVKVELIEFNLLNENNLDLVEMNYELVFCAAGYLGKNIELGFNDLSDSDKIIKINYSNLILFLSQIAEDLIKKGKGTIICLSSVAGERGRQSNFIYGSAKAGLTTYLSGLRNFLYKKGIHVLTVKPGFMKTKMTAHLDLPKSLTIRPQKAAELIYRAYKNKKNTIYISVIWKYIMMIIKIIPEFIFKKMSL